MRIRLLLSIVLLALMLPYTFSCLEEISICNKNSDCCSEICCKRRCCPNGKTCNNREACKLDIIECTCTQPDGSTFPFSKCDTLGPCRNSHCDPVCANSIHCTTPGTCTGKFERCIRGSCVGPWTLISLNYKFRREIWS